MATSIQAALAKAQQLLQENFILEPPVDVQELAKNSGVDVRIVTLPREYYDVSGFINIEDNKPVMYINADDNANRQKFTMAHELGHWLLHEKAIRLDPQKAILFRRPLGEPNPDPLEKQANAFAAEVLVPMSMFEKVKDKPVKELAILFEVSPDVIGYRKVASDYVAKDSRTTQKR